MEETVQKLALRVLKAINKSGISSIQLDDVPDECCKGCHINLNRWTLIVSDETLKRLSKQSHSLPFYFLDCSASNITGMFHKFWTPMTCPDGIISLSMVGAKEVTEFGLAMIARRNPNLRNLDISSCSKITDPGLREIGLACSNLIDLIMPGCHGIEGSGLIAIADNCKHIMKLNISRCRSIQSWSIKKIFYGCSKLEEVYVSGLNVVSDEEIRVLAQTCPHLMYLEARDCPYVSDQAILAISQYCPDIDFIDVSRTNMQFRISDVSLLALGQRSASLRVLRLNGCDQISDVGLTWLAEGCKVLEELDVGGCPKVSDAGLRSIGSGCHVLTALDVTMNKLISDIGLTSISSGCPKLKKLVCQGLYLLADPRLSAPKKGEPLEAWEAIVGVPAVAKYCPNMESINLTGCFRLNIALQEHLSTMVHLKILNLMGCNQCTQSALEAVATGCQKIEELVLTDCGKAVNNVSVSAFATHCKNLKSIVLTRCDGVRGAAMKAISQLEHLEKLDLSGCKSLTDMMFLPITEVDRVPKLRFLSLIGAKSITDTTMAWIASKDHAILLLAAKGSCISQHGIRAVRDYFPFSDLLENDTFFGFWPKSRVDDKKLLNKYHDMKVAVTKVQAKLRASISKKIVLRIMLFRRRENAVTVIQRAIRLFWARKELRRRQLIAHRFERAAAIIANYMRIAPAKKRVQRQRHHLYVHHQNRTAVLIQTQWRVYQAKCILQFRLERKRQYHHRRKLAATKIQSIARVYFAKNRVLHIKEMIRGKEVVKERKARFLQRCYRGYRGRAYAAEVRQEIFKRTVFFDICAKKIQRCAKAFRFRREISNRASRRGLRRRSAVSIQALMRGTLARMLYSVLVTERDDFVENAAAIKIQSIIRTKQAYLRIRLMFIQAVDEMKLKKRSATKIQTQYRCLIARRVLRLREDNSRDMRRRQVQLKLDSATKIQALFRGNKGRARFEAAIKERKGKWKELFDEDKKRRFFYNKLTGEIRWRMPQDLLDLVPRPTCDNCAFYEGTMECQVCNEIFCNQCFEQIHYGGRRKDHDFRSLYDYYGKRIDYGDGVFPCKWPSEVMQDEVQGWMLRVAPIRDPVVKHAGDWEEYQEIDSSGGAGKTFYFNRATFEATYDMPPELVAPPPAPATTAGAGDVGYGYDFNSSGGYDSTGYNYNGSGYYDNAAYAQGYEQQGSGSYDYEYSGGYSEGPSGWNGNGSSSSSRQYGYSGRGIGVRGDADAGCGGGGGGGGHQEYDGNSQYGENYGSELPATFGAAPLPTDRSRTRDPLKSSRRREGGGGGGGAAADAMSSIKEEPRQTPPEQTRAERVLEEGYNIGMKSARGGGVSVPATARTARGGGGSTNMPPVPNTGRSGLGDPVGKKKPSLTGKLFHKGDDG